MFWSVIDGWDSYGTGRESIIEISESEAEQTMQYPDITYEPCDEFELSFAVNGESPRLLSAKTRRSECEV